MPKPYPEEFRQDVVRVARNRGPGVTVEQVAADFGVHAMTLWKWMRRADIDDGAKPGTSSQESAELREARRRIKLLEQENEVLRRAAAYLRRIFVCALVRCCTSALSRSQTPTPVARASRQRDVLQGTALATRLRCASA
ncbi:transposase [Streptomyces sp. NPDC004044]